MHHDSSGNACQESGFIMNAIIGDPPTKFSACSVNYITDFFDTDYDYNGRCLENKPTTVFHFFVF